MSGVESSNTVDLITYDPKADEYALIMVETRGWDGSDERLQQISKKVENYLSFAVNGQMTTLYPESLGRRIRIQLDCDHPPDPISWRFLEMLRRLLDDEGIRFVVDVRD
jgi:hypothetical protein